MSLKQCVWHSLSLRNNPFVLARRLTESVKLILEISVREVIFADYSIIMSRLRTLKITDNHVKFARCVTSRL